MNTGKYTYSVKFNDVFPVMMDILGAKKQNELAHFLDVSVAAITNFKTQNYFPIDQIIKFAIKKDVSIDRMLGRCEPGGGDYSTRKRGGDAMGKEDQRRLEDTHYAKFPLMSRNGQISFQRLQMIKLFALKEWLIPQLNGSPEDVFITVMEGNSMDDFIKTGDILLCDGTRGHLSEVSIDDSVYVLSVEGKEPIVRRLQRLPGNMVRVIADNKLYESFCVPIQSDCQVLGRVVWIAHRVQCR